MWNEKLTFGHAGDFENAEILHTCSFGGSLGITLPFFHNSDFLGAWSRVLSQKRG